MRNGGSSVGKEGTQEHIHKYFDLKRSIAVITTLIQVLLGNVIIFFTMYKNAFHDTSHFLII